MIFAATGHRPCKLGGYGDDVFNRLTALARAHLSERQPSSTISGMALGWDQAFAQASVDLGIPFIAAVPFDGQERRWPKESWPRYRRLLDAATAVEIVSDIPGTRALQKRNEWMVDRADGIVALWDGSWGGTFNCIRYANRVKRPVENLWSKWADALKKGGSPTDLTKLLV